MESINKIRIALYQATDSNGNPLYTSAQIEEMTDKEIKYNYDNLHSDTILIDSLRQKSRQESGTLGGTIGLIVGIAIASLLFYLFTL